MSPSGAISRFYGSDGKEEVKKKNVSNTSNAQMTAIINTTNNNLQAAEPPSVTTNQFLFSLEEAWRSVFHPLFWQRRADPRMPQPHIIHLSACHTDPLPKKSLTLQTAGLPGRRAQSRRRRRCCCRVCSGSGLETLPSLIPWATVSFSPC